MMATGHAAAWGPEGVGGWVHSRCLHTAAHQPSMSLSPSPASAPHTPRAAVHLQASIYTPRTAVHLQATYCRTAVLPCSIYTPHTAVHLQASMPPHLTQHHAPPPNLPSSTHRPHSSAASHTSQPQCSHPTLSPWGKKQVMHSLVLD